MPWDPDHYLRFANHRIRPGLELLTRIPDGEPRVIVDLGSGTGSLTALLAERWRSASTTGVDSSAEMIDRARHDHPDITWLHADIALWEPDDPVDVVFSNAALHWLEHHASLFPRLRSFLAPGGVVAVQMPDNWQAPTHQIPAEILDDEDWPEPARFALPQDRVAPPDAYMRWLQPAETDLWRTTYYQRLSGPDPVWNWVTGSMLRPVLAALEGPDLARFETLCRKRYAEAFPPDTGGGTTVPFSRLFIVARAG